MLVNWLTSNLNVNGSTIIDRDVIQTLTIEFCTNLLMVGVMTQIADKNTPIQDTFRVSIFGMEVDEGGRRVKLKRGM